MARIWGSEHLRRRTVRRTDAGSRTSWCALRHAPPQTSPRELSCSVCHSSLARSGSGSGSGCGVRPRSASLAPPSGRKHALLAQSRLPHDGSNGCQCTRTSKVPVRHSRTAAGIQTALAGRLACSRSLGADRGAWRCRLCARPSLITCRSPSHCCGSEARVHGSSAKGRQCAGCASHDRRKADAARRSTSRRVVAQLSPSRASSCGGKAAIDTSLVDEAKTCTYLRTRRRRVSTAVWVRLAGGESGREERAATGSVSEVSRHLVCGETPK